MALNLSLAITSVGPLKSGLALNGVATVTNTEAGNVEVMSIQITEASTMGAIICGPYFLTPNVAPGEGEPTLATSASGNYPFQVVCEVPNTPGASPNAPNSLHGNTFPSGNSYLRLAGTVLGNDGSSNLVGSATLNLPLTTPVAPFPVPQGGALQFNAGGNSINAFFF